MPKLNFKYTNGIQIISSANDKITLTSNSECTSYFLKKRFKSITLVSRSTSYLKVLLYKDLDESNRLYEKLVQIKTLNFGSDLFFAQFSNISVVQSLPLYTLSFLQKAFKCHKLIPVYTWGYIIEGKFLSIINLKKAFNLKISEGLLVSLELLINTQLIINFNDDSYFLTSDFLDTNLQKIPSIFSLVLKN